MLSALHAAPELPLGGQQQVLVEVANPHQHQSQYVSDYPERRQLRLTEAGRTRVERARKEKQEWLAQVLYKRLTAEEKAVLLESIKILSKLIDE